MVPHEPLHGPNLGTPLTKGPFENLTAEQQLTVLEEVALALLTKTPVPEHTAVMENAVYYVYCFIFQAFETDVKGGELAFGQDVLDALGRCGKPEKVEEEKEKDDDESDDYELKSEDECVYYDPYMGCMDVEKWEGAVEEVADRILWDRDFELGDLSPGVMAFMHIQPNCFDDEEEVFGDPGAEDRLYVLCRRFYKG